MEYMRSRRTLELNPEHPIIQGLNSQLSSGASNAKVRMPLLNRGLSHVTIPVLRIGDRAAWADWRPYTMSRSTCTSQSAFGPSCHRKTPDPTFWLS